MTDLVNKIIVGDCLDVMGRMPDESVDLIFTSPPYNVGLNYIGYEDNLPDDEYKTLMERWFGEMYRVSSDGTRAYIVVPDKHLFWILQRIVVEAPWNFIQMLVWCKPNLTGSSRRIREDWNYMTEPILLLRKGKRTPMFSSEYSRTFNWFAEPVPQTNYKEGRIHPAQFPIGLCVQIIARTPGQVVLDPFCGSGQSLRAAKALGRDYIGIEISDEVARMARENVELPVDLDKIAQKRKLW